MTRIVFAELAKVPKPDELRARPDLGRFVPADNLAVMDKEPLPWADEDFKKKIADKVEAEIKGLPSEDEKWGVMGLIGLNKALESVDDRYRSPFMPFGLSGIMAAAAAVFFAYIGFDAISTHSEEAKKPQRDVPIGILASLVVCTLLYVCVSAVITGMEPYPLIDPDAAIAEAFHRRSLQAESLNSNSVESWTLWISAGVIATGGLAGMTSVILITLLSQARIFLAMARDGLLPERIFGAVHPRFRTPHLSTMLTGGLLCVVTALTPIDLLFNMVNIGTLLAFIIVCASVLLLRIRRPEAAPVPLPAGLCPRATRDVGQFDHDDVSAARHLVSPVRLVGDRIGHLFLLRSRAQHSGQRHETGLTSVARRLVWLASMTRWAML